MTRIILLIISLCCSITAFPVLTVGRGASAISSSAFADRADIDSVIISASVRNIGASAFARCSNLRSVRFEKGSRLTSIGDNAFLATAVDSVRLPAGVAKLGIGVWRECDSLRFADLRSSLTILPRETFEWCSHLDSVALPSGLTEIGQLAFGYCALRTISLPRSLRVIGMNAFSFCKLQGELVIPAGVSELASYAFSENPEITSVRLPSGCRELGELIFTGCYGLKAIHTVTKIPPAFECNSFLFDPDETLLYDTVSLIVPSGSADSYRGAHAWRLFRHIE